MIFLNGIFAVSKPENVFFHEISNKTLVDLEFCPNLKAVSNVTGSHIQYWCCLNFLQMLIELSEGQY